MEGLYDTYLFEQPMSSHYAACAEKMKEYKGDRWEYLYDFAYKVFDYLTVKTLIAENLVPYYKKKNEEALEEIAGHWLPMLKEKVIAVHEAHKAMWMQSYKVIGWANMDIRYAGVAARCDTAKMLIDRYTDHKDDVIEELEEESTPLNYSVFNHRNSKRTDMFTEGHVKIVKNACKASIVIVKLIYKERSWKSCCICIVPSKLSANL